MPFVILAAVIAAVCMVVGFVNIINWIILNVEEKPEPPSSRAIPSNPLPQSSLNGEAVRIKLEDLFFQNRIQKDVLNEILSSLNMRPATDSTIPIQVETKPTEVFVSEKSVEKRTPPIQVAPPPNETPQPTGFFSSQNIKLMLVSGCTLFVLSAYLFVRSYWQFIPHFLKFSGLAFFTVGIHGLGKFFLKKNQMPKTVEALLSLAALLVPFNFYAGNTLLFNQQFSAYGTWTAGLLAMFLVALYSYSLFPSLGLAFGSAIGLIGTFFMGGLTLELDWQAVLLMTAGGSLLSLAINLILQAKDNFKKGFEIAVNAASGLTFFSLLINGFFLHRPEHWMAAGTFIIIGMIFAIQARTIQAHFAYIAGLAFMMGGAVLLHHFQVPSFKYGLFFVPGSYLLILRAWKFQKDGRPDLASPYFNLGQISLLGSILTILPYFEFYTEAGFGTLFVILTLALVAYVAMAALYQDSIYTYAGILVLLFQTFTCLWHYQLSFASGLIVFGVVGTIMTLSGSFLKSRPSELMGNPLTLMGIITITTGIGILAGKWGVSFPENGVWVNRLSGPELNAGIWVGSMGAFAYLLLAWIKRNSALVYPALASFSLVYLFALSKWGIPIDLLNVSMITVVSVCIGYLFTMARKNTISRSFFVWAELVFFVVALSSIFQGTEIALKAMMISLAAFLPAILIGEIDLVVSALFALYGTHLVWFWRSYGNLPDRYFLYAVQLLLVNSGVVILRTLLASWKRDYNILPFRIFTLAFSVISLAMALPDKTNAWQVFLGCGFLALISSHFNYEGRYKFVGTFLILAAYELFLRSKGFEMVELYSVPAGVYFLIYGYLNRKGKDLKNLLNLAGQGFVYLPSFIEAVHETWEWHGIFLGVASLGLMLWGIHQRNKLLTFGSLVVLISNGMVQSVQFLTAVPRWIYLGLGGTILVGLGGLFEFQRESLTRLKSQVVNSFDGWD